MERSMQLNYTEHMEERLFGVFGAFDDDNEDYSNLIEALNSEDMFRSYGEGLLFFLRKRNSDVTLESAVDYIKECCKKTGVPEKDIGSINKLKGYFKEDKRPKKSVDSRYSLFALAFALELCPSETAEIFQKVYLDRAFDYRSEQDVICYFCLEHKKTWQEAQHLIESVCCDGVNTTDATLYTAQIKECVERIVDEAELLNYIEQHRNNFSKKNVSAHNVKENLLHTAQAIAKFEAELPGNEDVYKNSNRDSLNFLYEVITGRSVSGEKGTKTLFKNARLPKEIKSRFPEAITLSKKEPTYEELRKLIILLFSYSFWFNAQRKPDLWNIEDYKREIDVYLDESGFSPLYYGNPYDWLFLYCTLSDRPLDTFRGILEEILPEE